MRVIVNTIAQYARTAINLLLSLYSTRLILLALGLDDYGIYTLVAGVISILSFVVNALVVTTQRYLSFHSSSNDTQLMKEVFNNSLLIHIGIGIIGALVIELLGIPLFDGYFNISADRLFAAKSVYHCVTAMLLFSFVTSPYRALLISHENIIYISIVDVLDGFLKLAIAILLTYTNGDKLIIYALLLSAIQLLNLIAFFIYDKIKYEECIFPTIKGFNLQYIKDITSFAGWTIYSIGCITGRTQGISVIINKFYSVAVNAAYGVALQVNGALMFLSQSILNAMNPQIMKSEGAGDRKRMLFLSEVESKSCYFLMALVLIPMIVEMPKVLELWLKTVPDYSVVFCRGILIASLVDQLTVGLGSANQAIGDIKWYSIFVNTIKLLTIIPIIISLKFFSDRIELIMVFYIMFEFICAFVRLPFLSRTSGLSIKEFIINVNVREIIPTLIMVLTAVSINHMINAKWGILANIIISSMAGCFAIYATGLTQVEKELFNNIIRKTIQR